ncbi:cell division suppressor protein YneA [Anaerovorax odorimutans]|uniref:cell division suppressor protein YneA n=1 Tax=Anaerovorax odorimutans TaxID=109327 RepID=UPI00210A0B88
MFIVLTLLITATAATTILGFNNADGMTKQEYIQVQVESGDTLWSIADQYMPADMDRRESVYIISQTNETSASELYPGQTLKIPVEV